MIREFLIVLVILERKKMFCMPSVETSSYLSYVFFLTNRTSLLVYPTYAISSLAVGCLVFKWCWIELLVLCPVCSLVCIECLVIWLDSLTMKLKVTDFVLVQVFTWIFSCYFLWCIVITRFVKFQQWRKIHCIIRSEY